VALTLGCGSPQHGDLKAAQSRGKVGVLLASHGDIDDLSELEDYIKTAFLNNVGIPLPGWIRGPITEPAYLLSVNTVREQYEKIGPTKYRDNAVKQAAVVTAALARLGLNAKAYFGANFTFPFIHDALGQMRADGVERVLVFNKGGQFSYASSGENMDDVLKYLNDHPDWDVEAIGRFQYSEDERFREVMASAIERDLEANFAGIPAEKVCVLIASHGLPKWLTDKGDPAIRQMRRTFHWLEAKFSGYRLYHGFLNDDFIPGGKWVKPDAKAVAEQMRSDGCVNVLMDGRLSFTNHHRATLYDLNLVAREVLEKNKGVSAESLSTKVVLAPNFDTDSDYANLMAELSRETLERSGDVVVLKEHGKKALKDGSISTPGNFADAFKRFVWPD
jgi:protoheme ferro-lyase